MTLLRAFCKVCTRASASWQSWVTRWCSLSLLKRSSSASFTWKQQHVKCDILFCFHTWKKLNRIYSHIFLYHSYKDLTKIQYHITTVNNGVNNGYFLRACRYLDYSSPPRNVKGMVLQYQVDTNSWRKCNNINLSTLWTSNDFLNVYLTRLFLKLSVNFICIFVLSYLLFLVLLVICYSIVYSIFYYCILKL